MKTKNYSRLLSLLLCGLVLSACSSTGDDVSTSDNVTADSTSETEESTETQFMPDSLPDDLDFGKKSVKILWWEEQKEFVDEQTGEVVDDALYARDAAVEERLNVTLDHIGMSYSWDTRDTYIGSIRNSVMSGDNAYDIVSGQYATMPSLITEGVYLDLMKLDYLDFEKPWWVNALIEETAIDGKLYLVAGNISKTSISTVCCMFGNKRLFEDYNLGNPTELVNAGTWTIDKVRELTADIHTDINSNEQKDETDSYGLVLYNTNAITGFQQSFNLQVTTKNSDGYPELTFGTERVANALEKLCSYIHDSKGVYLGKDGEEVTNYAIFSEGRSLLTTGFFSQAGEVYKDMEDDFYILPYPKLDESQENYYTRLGEANSLFGITASCSDPNMAAAVMEAMSSEGYRTVAPAYYEVALKVKYSRSDESAQMFDLIRENVMFDFGALYGSALDIPFYSIKSFVYGNSGTWASYYASNVDKAKGAIDKFYEAVQNLEN